MTNLTNENIDDFVNQMDIWAWECDVDLKLCFMSDNFERITKTPSHELRGLKLTDIAEQLLPQSEREQFCTTISNGMPIDHLRFPWKARGDKIRWHAIYGHAILSESGAVLGYRGYGRALTCSTSNQWTTARTKTEQTPSTSISDRDDNDNQNATWRFRFSDQSLKWSSALFEMSGLDESNGMTLEKLLSMYSEEDRRLLIEAKTASLKSGEPFDIALTLSPKSDAPFQMRIYGVPDFENGQAHGFSGFSQRLLESETEPACQMEAQQDSRLDDVIAHQEERRNQMREELLLAVQEDKIVPHYQSVVDLKTGALSGLESFARWHHPTKGLLSAGVFMDLFEDDKTTTAMGQRLLTTVLKDMAQWHANNVHFGRVGYNVSAADLRDPKFAETVIFMLENHGLKPRHLVLEVRDEALDQSADEGSVDQLKTLRAHGISIAFRSSGARTYSADERFSIPFDILKIGGDLVRNTMSSDGHSAIVRSMISMGKELGYSSVAEGVETQAQVNELKQWGCERGQGYFFEKPKSFQDISKSLVDLSKAA